MIACLQYYFRLPFANNAFSLKNNRRWKLPHTINNRCAAVLYCKSGNFKFIWDGSRPKTKGLTSYLHSDGRIITPPILAVHQKYVKTQLSHEPNQPEAGIGEYCCTKNEAVIYQRALCLCAAFLILWEWAKQTTKKRNNQDHRGLIWISTLGFLLATPFVKLNVKYPKSLECLLLFVTTKTTNMSSKNTRVAIYKCWSMWIEEEIALRRGGSIERKKGRPPKEAWLNEWMWLILLTTDAASSYNLEHSSRGFANINPPLQRGINPFPMCKYVRV